ncbi:hypothetical protein D4A92_23490 (plasmid) [Rhizobium rosettiformans]|uniref:Uncharacterized protein n=1 Tax=Rhizobium rosettiformans TaxID=1368430 RepID=A0ABX7F520_9HYPH|nr:hypothetical protein D4A92_23490 [Rhizobium rosettiformans]
MRKDQIAHSSMRSCKRALLYAVGNDHYFFGDLDVPDDRAEEINARVESICERYGPRDHLRPAIALHLRRLDLWIDVDAESRLTRWTGRSVSPGTVSASG